MYFQGVIIMHGYSQYVPMMFKKLFEVVSKKNTLFYVTSYRYFNLTLFLKSALTALANFLGESGGMEKDLSIKFFTAIYES